MGKLANSATSALHERGELQARNRLKINADKQKQAKAMALAKNRVTRFPLKVRNSLIMRGFGSTLPGATLRTWPEAMRRSSGCKAKSRRWRKNHRAFAKLNKDSERLAAGKPPAMWHIPLRIEGDIGEERTKLDEFQIELRKLELQASHTQRLINHGPGSDDVLGDEPEEDIMDSNRTSGLSLGEDSGKELG